MSRVQIIFTVTNDLAFDQRMQRICTTLQTNEFDVLLIGRTLKRRSELSDHPYKQKRLKCWFNNGWMFYAEFNIRLFFFLLHRKPDIVGSVDLDTILAGLFAAKLTGAAITYDAHEYFTEVPELMGRSFVKGIWKRIEAFAMPRVDKAYTVNTALSMLYKSDYGIDFKRVRNLPAMRDLNSRQEADVHTEAYVIYQGALNKGRGLEQLIDVMATTNTPLWIAGEGDLSIALRKRAAALSANNIKFLGNVPPDQLRSITQNALLGVNLLEPIGKSYQLSLSNKFFDYMMAGIPQICIDFPEYRSVCDKYPFAYLIPDLKSETLNSALELLISSPEKRLILRENALKARKELNWEKESKVLLQIYKEING